MSDREIRTLRPEAVELRAKTENGKPILTGYAARFNSRSLPMRDPDVANGAEFVEVILPGAFADTLADESIDIVALAYHSDHHPLARRSRGTLQLVEDEHGLRCRITPANNTLGNDIVESVTRGDLESMSFGFFVEEDRMTQDENGMVIREIVKANVFEVSVVVWPAYPESSIKVRQEIRSDVFKRIADMREPKQEPQEASEAKPVQEETRELPPMALLLMIQRQAEKSAGMCR